MLKMNNLTPQERRETVTNAINDLVEDKIGVYPDEQDEFDADLNLDALDVMEIVLDLEDHFNIGVDGDTVDDIVTISDMIEAILEQVD